MAVDATGTPTTNYGIPKFNTATDAPSGKGGNAQVDFIDNLLKTTFVSAPVGVVTSEVLVYNGTSWDRSSVTKLTANNNIKFDGYSTSLPGSPYDGQVYTLVDSTTTPTYQWTFRYNAGSSSSFKWEFVGGAPVYAAVETAQTTGTTGGFVDLATVGPSFTLPRAGDYLFRYSADAGNNGAGNTDIVGLIKNGGEVDRMVQAIGVALGQAAMMREIVLTGLAASDAFKLQYFTTGGTATYLRRRLTVIPIRVS
jgi:hypothetical protein